jgi:hypothetical protein
MLTVGILGREQKKMVRNVKCEPGKIGNKGMHAAMHTHSPPSGTDSLSHTPDWPDW